MTNLTGLSFLWIPILFAVIAAIYGLRTLLGVRQVTADARADYAYKQERDMIPAGLDQDTYERIYRRVYGPRAPAHIFAAMVGLLFVTPLAMFGLEQGLNLIYNASGQNRVIEPGFLVWQFFLFFGIIFIWVGVAYLAARRYHRTTPGSLQSEIDRHLYADDAFGESF